MKRKSAKWEEKLKKAMKVIQDTPSLKVIFGDE